MQWNCELVFGKQGCGKTTHANFITEQFPRVLVADAGFRDFKSCQYVESFDALLTELERVNAAETQRPFRLAYIFRPAEYHMVFKTALRLKNILLVLEEGYRFDFDDDNAIECTFNGRHHMTHLLFVAQFPKSCPTDLRRSATRIISYKQTFPDDIEWMAEAVGEEAYKLPELGGPPVKPPHKYLEWTGEIGSKINDPLTILE